MAYLLCKGTRFKGKSYTKCQQVHVISKNSSLQNGIYLEVFADGKKQTISSIYH